MDCNHSHQRTASKEKEIFAILVEIGIVNKKDPFLISTKMAAVTQNANHLYTYPCSPELRNNYLPELISFELNQGGGRMPHFERGLS